MMIKQEPSTGDADSCSSPNQKAKGKVGYRKFSIIESALIPY